ncbi:MAG: hypothetical protein RIB41_09980 [Oceanibaculum nanhaiense]|jgi:hypothetical protein|uniref:hypothetical protein n=1 Tax=Oceanibaculum nanhaiense TaxID=1909734 RepID=UPI0032ECF42D
MTADADIAPIGEQTGERATQEPPALPAEIGIEGDSAEAVALALFREVLARDPDAGRQDGRLQGNALLDLYAQCLRTVRHPGSRLDGAAQASATQGNAARASASGEASGGSYPVPELKTRL